MPAPPPTADPEVAEVVDLAARLCAIPSVTVPADRADLAAVRAARADQPSLPERFSCLATRLADRFEGERVRLLSVTVGQDGNFNTWDGSGELVLAIDAPMEEVAGWAAAQRDPGLELTVAASPPAPRAGPAVLGLDVREVLAHAPVVRPLLDSLPGHLWGPDAWTRVNDRPAWRCPDDHPDLAPLLEAWEAVAGQRCPDLVKLHGNDGGSLAELQQRDDDALAEAGIAHVVVFGQVGARPHGPGESHRISSIRPYLEVLDRWAASYEDA